MKISENDEICGTLLLDEIYANGCILLGHEYESFLSQQIHNNFQPILLSLKQSFYDKKHRHKPNFNNGVGFTLELLLEEREKMDVKMDKIIADSD